MRAGLKKKAGGRGGGRSPPRGGGEIMLSADPARADYVQTPMHGVHTWPKGTITAEDAVLRTNERLKRQHSLTIPITANLVALMFVSLADLTQDQRQVLTSLMAHRNRPLATTASKSSVKSTWKSFVRRDQEMPESHF